MPHPTPRPPCRTLLLRLLPDVHIFTDSSLRGADAGASPGFGITLTAHSTSGCTHSAQRATGRAPPSVRGLGAGDEDASASDGGPPELPEDMGSDAAARLLTEIARGGCLDTSSQPLVLTFMALCPEDVSRVRVGQLGPGAIATLRLLRDVWGIKFKLTPQVASHATPAAAGTTTPGAGAAAAATTAAALGGAGTGASVSGVKRPRPTDAATATAAAGGDDDADGAGAAAAAAAVVDPLTGMPISADVAAPVSASTVLVSCLGLGIKNMSKKVT